MNDIKRNALRADLTNRLRALDALAALPKAESAESITIDFEGHRVAFNMNAFTRPLVEAVLVEEHARLEAIALGVDRKVAS